MLIFKLLARRGYMNGDPDYGNDWTPTEGPEDTPVVEKTPVADKEPEAEPEEDEPEAEDDEPEDKDKKEEPKAGEEKPKKKGIIPLERHESVLARERERREGLERELAKYQGAQVITQTNDQIAQREAKLADLDKQYAKQMADNETEKAAATMGQIRMLDREIMQLDAQTKIAAAEARAIEANRYSVAITRIEAAYPVLDEDSAEFDKETYEDVLDLMNAYKAQGRTPTDALQRAVKMKMGAATPKQKDATSVKPRADVEAETRAERKKEGIDKVLKAVNGQPGTATAKAGANNDAAGAALTAKDIIKMSYAKFSKVDQDVLAKARGDDFVGS